MSPPTPSLLAGQQEEHPAFKKLGFSQSLSKENEYSIILL